VRTTRFPNNPVTMMTGSSQNFFRVRMYSQNSDKNSISSLVARASLLRVRSALYYAAGESIRERYSAHVCAGD
jgi:hypothetical protein